MNYASGPAGDGGEQTSNDYTTPTNLKSGLLNTSRKYSIYATHTATDATTAVPLNNIIIFE